MTESGTQTDEPPVSPPPAPAVSPEAATKASAATSLNARLAPQDLAAEQSVIGGILLSNEQLWDVADIIKSVDFYREPHRKIFQALLDLGQRQEAIDRVTLADELRKNGHLESVGGIQYIETLDASVPASANLARYAKIVRDKARWRRLIEAGHGIARQGYEQLGDVDDAVESAEEKIFGVADSGLSSGVEPMSAIVTRVFGTIESNYDRQGEITGLPTGFEHLDRLTAGFQRKDLVIVAGRPSMGKTAIVMNMAGHVAIEQHLPVAVFSLEMDRDSLTKRLFSSEARVDGQRLRNGKLLDEDWAPLAKTADKLFKAPLLIDDTPALSCMELRARARRLKAKHPKLALVVVDYLQLMRGRQHRESNREQEIADISGTLKAVAKELDVPVVALSQLSRALEKREDKRPMLSDLRESGSLEQDADMVLFLYRDEVYNRRSRDKGTAEIIIGKQRNGPTGTVRVAFMKSYTRFENLAEEDAYPSEWGED